MSTGTATGVDMICVVCSVLKSKFLILFTLFLYFFVTRLMTGKPVYATSKKKWCQPDVQLSKLRVLCTVVSQSYD